MICIADLEGTLTTGSVQVGLARYRQHTQQAAQTLRPAEVSEWIVEHELWPRRTPLVELLSHRNADQVRLIICSTVMADVLEAFSRRLKAEPLIVPVSPAGEVQVGQTGGRRKAQQVKRYLNGERVDYAFTDSLDDLPLLDLAARPCVVNPDQRLLSYARAKAWRILNFTQVGPSVSGLIL